VEPPRGLITTAVTRYRRRRERFRANRPSPTPAGGPAAATRCVSNGLRRASGRKPEFRG
jgi:hypothetical protein